MNDCILNIYGKLYPQLCLTFTLDGTFTRVFVCTGSKGQNPNLYY